MKEFSTTINKYVILQIVLAFFGKPWFYLGCHFSNNMNSALILNTIPDLADYIIRIITVILLIIDFNKFKLKNVLLSCIAALFFPLLGIVSFTILLLMNERNNEMS